MIKKILVAVLTTFCFINMMAQDLTVRSMEVLSMDTYASVHRRVDLNNNPCAVVRVSLPISGATFSGNVVGDVKRDGSDYLVYMPAGSKKLWVKHPNFHELEVVFGDHEIQRLQSLVTYRITINAPMQQSQTLATAERSIDETVFPKWLFTQKDLWYGISMPCSNPVLAKKHALANAFLLYTLNSGKGKMKSLMNYNLNQEDKSSESSKHLITHSNFISAEQVTIDCIACNVDREFYNSRGEYVVECNFVQTKSGNCKCSITRSIDYNNETGESLTSSVKIEATIEGCDMVVTTEYGKDGGYSVEIDGAPMINSRALAYDNLSWMRDGKNAERSLAYNISTSCGATMTQLLLSLPWLPYSYKCSSLVSYDISVIDNGITDVLEDTSIFKGTYKVLVDTIIRPLDLNIERIDQNKLFFKLNSKNILADNPKNLSGLALFEANPMIVTNHSMKCPLEQKTYLGLFMNVWRHLIANSLVYDKIRTTPTDENDYAESTDVTFDEGMPTVLYSRIMLIDDSKSENFDVDYSINPSDANTILNLRIGTKVAGDVLRQTGTVSTVWGTNVEKEGKKMAKKVYNDGWELLCEPNGLSLDLIFLHTWGHLARPVSQVTSKDVCDAILIGDCLANSYYREMVHDAAKSHSVLHAEFNKKLYYENAFSSPLWSYKLFRALPDGNIEVETTHIYKNDEIIK